MLRELETSSVYLDSDRQGQNFRNFKIAQYLHTNPHDKKLVDVDFCENAITARAFNQKIKNI